jgi:hypothetical protein
MRKSFKKHTGVKTASAFYFGLEGVTPDRFFKDVQHVFYEGEWQRHINNLLFATDSYDNKHQMVEKRRVLSNEDLVTLKKRLAIYPLRTGQHNWIGLETLKGSTATQIKDLMEILSIILRGILKKNQPCDCLASSGICSFVNSTQVQLLVL